MGDYYMGHDVHSWESVFVVQQADGVVIGRGRIPTAAAAFRQWRDHHAPGARGPVALETRTLAFFAARALAAIDLRPVVIDPLRGPREGPPTQPEERSTRCVRAVR